MYRKIVSFAGAVLLLLIGGGAGAVLAASQQAALLTAVGTAFTYQGWLTDGGVAANGVFDFEFKLYDSLSAGAQVGSTVEVGDVTVTDGYFTVQLDFGSGAFNGEARWLEIGVRDGASTGVYTALTPRQALTPVPYAIASKNLVDDLGNSLVRAGSQNLLAGAYAGNAITTGSSNTAVGHAALYSTTEGQDNVAVGYQALYNNLTGLNNIAIGRQAMFDNTEGFQNAGFGSSALANNTTGINNTGVGGTALYTNESGSNNTAIGSSADVSSAGLFNATAIGYSAVVDASNKIRLGNSSVTVIEGQVAYTFTSDANLKENFRALDGEAVLEKLSQVPISSWNYIDQDAEAIRHYGPMAQDFYAAFGNDGIGVIGSETTLNSGDMAGITLAAVQALETRTAELQAELEQLKAGEGIKASARSSDSGPLWGLLYFAIFAAGWWLGRRSQKLKTSADRSEKNALAM